MALPSSGAISLSDVNTNIGASSTATITMNDTPVRWLANGNTSTSTVDMNSLRGKSWVWTSNVSQSSFTSFKPQATAVDSDGYTYSAVYSQGPGFFLFKFNPVGVLVWATQITANSGYTLVGTYRNGLAVSAAGNVYVSVGVRIGSSSYYYGALKLNSSGTLQWSSFITVNPTLNFGENGSLGIDSSENVYCRVFQEGDAPQGSIVAKWNSSGSLQFQKNVQGTYGTIGYGGIFVDPVNNYIYWTGLGNPTTNGILIKYDTNMSQQWGTYLTTGVGCRIDSVAVNTSNQNVYVGVGSPTAGIAKFNSSGTLQWQKAFSKGGTYNAMAADTSDNAYIQMAEGGGSNTPTIIKVSTSGSITSQLLFNTPNNSYGTSDPMGGVAAGNGFISASLSTTTGSGIPITGISAIKILNSVATPAGTYGRVIVSANNATVSDSSYTTGSVTPTVTNSSYGGIFNIVSGSSVTSSFTQAVALI